MSAQALVDEFERKSEALRSASAEVAQLRAQVTELKLASDEKDKKIAAANSKLTAAGEQEPGAAQGEGEESGEKNQPAECKESGESKEQAEARESGEGKEMAEGKEAASGPGGSLKVAALQTLLKENPGEIERLRSELQAASLKQA